MAGHDSDDSSTIESVMEKIEHKISEKIHHDSSSSSSSDSDDDNHNPTSAATFFKSKIYRLFGRETPIHKLLGGGKPADVFLWRDKKVSASFLGTATALWILFELLEYHLLTLVCHISIFSIAALFLWSNASIFIKKSPPQIPHIELPERPVLEFASALRVEVNGAFSFLHDVASGKDLKKISSVIFGLWMLSIVGNSCNFITLFYIAVVLLLTVPVLYEKYEDEIDSFAEKAAAEIKEQYALFDAKVLSRVMSKVSRGLSKYKKAA